MNMKEAAERYLGNHNARIVLDGNGKYRIQRRRDRGPCYIGVDAEVWDLDSRLFDTEADAINAYNHTNVAQIVRYL